VTTPEKDDALAIGKLVVEQFALEKQIGKLRDEISIRARTYARIGRILISNPEQLVFEGQNVEEQFAGESAIDRSALDVDSAIAELRAAIVRQRVCKSELAALGVDPDEAEREKDQRASRALFHPANTHHFSEPDDVGAGGRKSKRGRLGFVASEKKADDKSATAK